ncbi:hypothetical protein [Mycobacterium sp. AZCC_0083]|uniref:hypothetical protein n=1 Tax=Mycobacterium sp. AZCC_0083 TaxID=2735882 RepID=UPI001609097C|nr:hypothetical protein [Mycobacterium sp. AZCC_0083]MBB5167085.1 hypothetical protein [Mycobacterium sp. AZCC_0083]
MAEIIIENQLDAWVVDLGYGDWIVLDGNVVEVRYVDGVRATPEVVALHYRHTSGSAYSDHTVVVPRTTRYKMLGFKLRR